MPTERQVPAYSSSGRRLRSYSLATALAHVNEKRAVAEYGKGGRLRCINFCPLPKNTAALEGAERVRKTAHLGQHYAFSESCGESGRRAWRFVEFLTPWERHAGDPAAFEAYLQSVFRAVPLSVLSMPRTWTEADLRRQFHRITEDGWLALFERAAEASGWAPVALLLALGSRETNLQNIRGDWRDGAYHGYGILQVDIGTDPDWCCQWDEDQVADSIARGVKILTAKREYLVRKGLAATLAAVTAAYNTGEANVVRSLRAGLDPDRTTTGRDYGADVLARMAVFSRLLQRPPAPPITHT